MLAAANGHLDVLRELVERDADKEKTSISGWNALMLAADEGH